MLEREVGVAAAMTRQKGWKAGKLGLLVVADRMVTCGSESPRRLSQVAALAGRTAVRTVEKPAPTQSQWRRFMVPPVCTGASGGGHSRAATLPCSRAVP